MLPGALCSFMGFLDFLGWLWLFPPLDPRPDHCWVGGRVEHICHKSHQGLLKVGAAFAQTLGKQPRGSRGWGSPMAPVAACLWGLCQSHVLLGEDRDVPTCHHLPGQQLLLRAVLRLCCDRRMSLHCPALPLQPWALSQRQQGDPSRGALGPWTVFPSPGGAASFHAPFELGSRKVAQDMSLHSSAVTLSPPDPGSASVPHHPSSLHRQQMLSKL